MEPAPTDESGQDKGAGEADAEEDLDEEVAIVVEHLRYGLQRQWGIMLCLAIHTQFLLGFDPGK